MDIGEPFIGFWSFPTIGVWVLILLFYLLYKCDNMRPTINKKIDLNELITKIAEITTITTFLSSYSMGSPISIA